MTNGQEANEARITYLENDIKELKDEIKNLREELIEKRGKIYKRIEDLENVDRNQNKILNPLKKFLGWIISAATGVISYISARSLLSLIN